MDHRNPNVLPALMHSLHTPNGAFVAPQPAERVSGKRQDIWSIVNDAAANSRTQPVINMGQGFFGYNPPDFVLEAARIVFDRVDCNQYAPTKGRPRLKKAIAEVYSPFLGKQLDPETEVTITTGANEGMLSAFMAFVESSDEVIVFEPFFDQYISNIEMPGGKVVYVPMHAPADGDVAVSSAGDWKFDIEQLKAAITPRTKMIVLNTPHNPIGKVLSRNELEAIAALCIAHNIIVLSDEVYDQLSYVSEPRICTLSPEIRRLTLTVGSAGKLFYATGWRVGWLIGPEHLIKHVSSAHTRICYSSVSPLQEAVAMSLEQVGKRRFFEESREEIRAKMEKFNEIWTELGLPFSVPEGGYFVVANLKKVQIPEGYLFPAHIAERPRDFQLSYFLINEIGVAAVPTSEFYSRERERTAENWLRFGVCKTNEVLESAKNRLRRLKKYIEAIPA
ncbi:PLP-dependent transferase [Neofusicoccum parvum]|nr:PLP-dependent transferase [Neofusicoccum parvum]